MRKKTKVSRLYLTRIKDYLFKPRFHFSRFQFNLMGLFFISVGIIGGSYLALSNIIPLIFAVSQTSTSITSDVEFGQGTLDSVEVVGGGEEGKVQIAGGGGGDPWYNQSWQYRKKLIIDNSAQAENLLDFQLMVKLTTINFTFSHAKSGGADIRFTDSDGTTLLPYEIEKWTDNTEAYIYTKVPQINASSNSDYIYVYYGNAAASSVQDAGAVWGNTRKWHLNEASVVNGTEIDELSSSDARLASVQGATVTSGKVGNGFQFNGTTQYLKQKVYQDQTGSTWGGAGHGLSLANGSAFFRAGETLGSELVTNGGMELDSDWMNRNTPPINERSNEQVHSGSYSRKFTVDSAYDGIRGTNFSMTSGKLYKITGSVYGDGTHNAVLMIYNNMYMDKTYSPLSGGVQGYKYPATWTTETWYWLCTQTSSNYMVFVEGGSNDTAGTFYADDISIKEVTSPNVATYATDANDYMLVLKDSASKTAWGYIDVADAAQTVGSDLFDPGAGTFDSGTYGWIPFGSNTIENDSQSLKVTYVDNGEGAKVLLSAASDLTTNLTVGKLYKLTFDAKVNAGSAVGVVVTAGGWSFADWLYGGDTSFTSKTIYFTATSATECILKVSWMQPGEIIWLDNVVLKEVTDVGVDGVHIVSTKGGSTRNWAGIETGFKYDDASYTYEVRKTDFQSTGPWTVGMWVYPTAFSCWGFMSKSSWWPVNSFIGFVSAEQVPYFVVGQSSGNYIGRRWSGAVSTNSWTKMDFTYDGGIVNTSVKVYVNGVRVDDMNYGSGTFTSMSDSPYPFTVGAIATPATCPFNGIADEAFVTNTELSANWIVAMYKSENDTFITYDSEQTSLPPSGTYTSPSNANAIDLNWNGGWSNGPNGGAFEANVTIPTNTSIAFSLRSATTREGLAVESWVNIGTATSSGIFVKTAAELAGVGTGHNRYVQVKATLATTDGVGNPSLNAYSAYYQADDANPVVNVTARAYTDAGQGTEINDDTWTNDQTVYFTFADAVDADSGVEGYCVYLGTTDSSDPYLTKGLLGENEQPGDNSGCPYVTHNSYLDLTTALPSPLSDGTYYLNVRAKDYAGNKFTDNNPGTPYKKFTLKYDGTDPSNPTGLSAPQNYQSSISSFTIYWPVTGSNAAQDTLSGVKGYQYKIGASGVWYGTNHTGGQGCTDLINATTSSYTLDENYDSLVEGENTFYFRTWDNACNVTDVTLVAILKYSGIAPTEPQNLQVVPESSTENSFSFSWSKPAIYAGEESGLTYCYTVNVVPSAISCNWTSGTSLAEDSYATQPGTNTFYVVAKDVAGNVNYDAYTSVNFTCNTQAPGIVRNVEISDISIKATGNWKLVVSWETPEYQGVGITMYRMYRSTSEEICTSGFGAFAEVGSTTGTSYADTGLNQQNYYYCVKACDSANNCSAVSGTVSELPTGRYYEPAKLVYGPVITSISTKRATVVWSTDRDSDSRVQYGLTSGEYFEEEVANSQQTTVHTITLSNLSAGATYYFRAKWTDEDGNTAMSGERSFQTDPPPVVKNVTTKNVNLNSATIQFTIVGAAGVKIYYGKTTSFGGVVEMSTSTIESTYISELSGLEDGTSYQYKLNALDSEEEEYEGHVYSFDTLPRPQVSNIQIQEVKETAQPTVEVSWESNTEVSSIVRYNVAGKEEEARDEVEIELTSGEHKMEITGLLSETRYELVVKGVDRLGNVAVSDKYEFTTATDSRPPQISNVKIEGTIITQRAGVSSEKSAQLVVSWESDEVSTSQVEYGEGTGDVYTQMSGEDSDMTYKHVVIISNLTPSKVYHLKMVSRDSAGNEGRSEDTVTITPKSTSTALELVINKLLEIFGFLG